MEYAIQILKESLERIDSSYERFVAKGGVQPTSVIAADNRRKAKELERAIKVLNEREKATQSNIK